MNTVRPSRAIKPIRGQDPTSLLAMKHARSVLPSTGMSSQEVWFATKTTGRPDGCARVPITRTFRPRLSVTPVQ